VKYYGAKLLFQFRTRRNGQENKMRVCEERLIRFAARSDSEAESKVRRYGRSEQWVDDTTDGRTVHFEFVGILDINDGLDALRSSEKEVVEVWYELYERLLPMERREGLLPHPSNYTLRGGPHRKNRLTVY
jgi:hypothetical protein